MFWYYWQDSTEQLLYQKKKNDNFVLVSLVAKPSSVENEK